MRNLSDIEGGIYTLTAVGIIGDHLSTRIALCQPQIREVNPFTLFLFQNNLWLLFDVFMMAVSLGVPYILMRKWSFNGRWAVLAYPLLFGMGRLAAAVHNLLLLGTVFF